MANTGVWFDIPVNDLDRAVGFYSEVMQVQMIPMEGPMRCALFPFQPGEVAGGLVPAGPSKPSLEGSTIYLNGGENLDQPLARVVAAGGEILQEKMPIGEHGFVAYFKDSEGNRVGLHSMS